MKYTDKQLNDLLVLAEKFNGLKRKIALTMIKSEMARENLNFLITSYWKVYEYWDGTCAAAKNLTPATSIIRMRSYVVKDLKELDYTEPVARRLSLRGKGKTPDSPFKEENLI